MFDLLNFITEPLFGFRIHKTVSNAKDLLLDAAALNGKAATLSQTALGKIQGLPSASKIQTNVENTFAHAHFARARALRAATALQKDEDLLAHIRPDAVADAIKFDL
eukprot:g6096.t1